MNEDESNDISQKPSGSTDPPALVNNNPLIDDDVGNGNEGGGVNHGNSHVLNNNNDNTHDLGNNLDNIRHDRDRHRRNVVNPDNRQEMNTNPRIEHVGNENGAAGRRNQNRRQNQRG